MMIDGSPSAASKLVVTGNADLAGTVTPVYGPGTYTTKSYTVLEAGSISGAGLTLDPARTVPASLADSLSATATTVDLSITATVIAPTNATIFGTAGAAALREGQRINGVQIGRAHVCTPVTTAHTVCRL